MSIKEWDGREKIEMKIFSILFVKIRPCEDLKRATTEM
jgi:hypothetical protein